MTDEEDKYEQEEPTGKANRVGGGEQADGWSGDSANTYAKKQKARAERRKAKQNPEAPPSYNRYKGWVL